MNLQVYLNKNKYKHKQAKNARKIIGSLHYFFSLNEQNLFLFKEPIMSHFSLQF